MQNDSFSRILRDSLKIMCSFAALTIAMALLAAPFLGAVVFFTGGHQILGTLSGALGFFLIIFIVRAIAGPDSSD